MLDFSPVFLQDLCEEFSRVRVVEDDVDSNCQVLVWELNVGGLANIELFSEQLVQSLMFKRGKLSFNEYLSYRFSLIQKLYSP
jgi:hypothetical protein